MYPNQDIVEKPGAVPPGREAGDDPQDQDDPPEPIPDWDERDNIRFRIISPVEGQAYRRNRAGQVTIKLEAAVQVNDGTRPSHENVVWYLDREKVLTGASGAIYPKLEPGKYTISLMLLPASGKGRGATVDSVRVVVQ